MKQNITQKSRMIVALALAAFVVSCSDGEIQFGEGPDRSIGAVPPTITSFKADPIEIQEGGSTTLSWKVMNADKMMISGLGTTGKFKYNNPDLKEADGKTVVEGISETTEFTLTAIGSGNAKPSGDEKPKPKAVEKPGDKPAALKPGELRKIATVTVKVVPKSEVAVSLTADAESVKLGESTILRWTVTPEDATITLTADRGKDKMVYIYGSEDCKDATASTLNDKKELDKVPAKGCALVYPEAPATTYTMKAVAKNGKEGTASKTITVSGAAIKAEILVNNSTTDVQVKAGETVTVSWRVEPASAKVKITAQGGVDSTCQAALPNNVQTDQTSLQCVVTADTIFTITAQVGELKAEDSIRVLIAKSANVGLKFETVPWAFANETVALKIIPADAAGIRGEMKVIVYGGERKELQNIGAEGTTVNVVVPAGGVKVEVVAGGATVANYQPITVMATTMRPLSSDGPEIAVTRVAIDANDPTKMYAGVQLEVSKDNPFGGKVRIYRQGSQQPIELKKAIKSIEGVISDGFFDAVKDYPVTAIAVREGKSSEIYVGVTGALFRSKDGGASFEIVDYVPRFKNGDYKDSYRTCAGKQQPGVKVGELVSFGQICDIIASSDGKLVVATDIGVFTIPNIDSHATMKEARDAFVGSPEPGKKASEKGYLTYGAVAHDLEKMDGQYYAATTRGVFASADGIKWEKSGDLGEAFALAGKGKMLYAGTAQGIAMMDKAFVPAQWTHKGSAGGTVLSLAADSYSPAIIAGTSNGAMISRDGGATFTPIAGADGEVRSVALVAKAPQVIDYAEQLPVSYALMIGSSKGTISGGANATVYNYGSRPISPLPQPGTPAAGTPEEPAAESNIPQGQETAAADDEDATIE